MYYSATNLPLLQIRVNDLMDCINTALIRYHKNKCGIDSFKFRLSGFAPRVMLNTWLEVELENGVKSLSISLNHPYTLPQTILGAVVELWFVGFQLKPQPIQIIRFHGLRVLSLVGLDLDQVMLQRIVLSCP
ncbi:hypothetical protein ACH5RR_032860 [Cinchona calisaya]|uniref:Uncharacterized protein n=1 Tax=Cinchona calisaya TaxID=153742 RepID=A0ABD2YJB4_9GENT